MSELSGVNIGFALTGSYCTFERIVPVIKTLAGMGAEITPIVSETVYKTDTRFGSAEYWVHTLEEMTGHKVISTIAGAEPVGPKKLLDILVVAPCTGNTLAKLAHGITDSSVTMACKAHLRNNRPVVLGISTNDGLSTAAVNIGTLLARKNYYFVPYEQDDAEGKPQSLVSVMENIPETVRLAITGKQMQPILV